MTGVSPSVVDESDALAFTLEDCSTRPTHDRILLVEPTHFDVTYEINPYMGGEVDHERVREQWEALRDVYARYADVVVLDPDEVWNAIESGSTDDLAHDDAVVPADRPDLVFGANHGLPTADGTGIVLASMATDERRGEPAYLAGWAAEEGYDVHRAPPAAFEGTGDAFWHPGRRLLWGGYGVRTERAAYDDLASRLDAPVCALELADDRYYHLDVCLTPLDERTALIQPEAFTDAGLDRLGDVFETLLEIPVVESREGMAGNAHSVDGHHVLLPAGNPETEAKLLEAGYEPVPIETSEFEKAGGSVFCLSLELGRPV
ncbi:dimethylarginine dimethylaminohydrolase family protein [Halovivax gelatinilyticus]|uniref:dimethylarginine dimethylaminohydrolase family protein n=1 Tax=Halovivax gelatinilyticus TaxID=2961597 RepID=UPI0020CA2EF3|nr:arginine deiminase-related protein [Halovivax gelatinilyticus]